MKQLITELIRKNSTGAMARVLNRDLPHKENWLQTAVHSLRSTRLTDRICVSFLIFAWLAASFVVNPVGDFPLNDDWAYGPAVRTLVEKGELRLSDWTGMNLIAQLFWGALFCLPAGYSFTALRFSTLALGLIGALATYGLLREARASSGVAILGSFVLAFNPIYFSLAFTYMTDVPFVAVATVASWLFLRGLRRDSLVELFLALALAGAAILIRQLGLVLPFAFACAYILKYGANVRRLCEAALAIGAGLALQIGYESWLRWSDHLPAGFGRQIHTLHAQLQHTWSFVISQAMTITVYALIYTGTFLFAFLIATHRTFFGRSGHAFQFIMAGISAAIFYALSISGKLMPLHGNILHEGGLGCCIDRSSQAPRYFWILLTFLGVLGAILIVNELWLSVDSMLPFRQKRSEERYTLPFALLVIIGGFAPLPFLGLGWAGFYDRYLIFFIPFLMLMIVATNRGNRFPAHSITLVVSTLTLIGTGAFSIAATHDYLAANRALWVALQHLLADGVSPERINGGFEFGGLYLYNIPSAHHQGQCCYWVVTDDYIVGSRERKGYATLAAYEIEHWLPWERGNIIVQKRVDITGAAALAAGDRPS